MANKTDNAAAARIMNTTPSTFFGGDAGRVFDCRGFAYLTQIMSTGSSGITATISRVLSSTVSAHSTGVGNQFTLAGSSEGAIQQTYVDWPFYFVTVSTASTTAKLNICAV